MSPTELSGAMNATRWCKKSICHATWRTSGGYVLVPFSIYACHPCAGAMLIFSVFSPVLSDFLTE